MSVSDYNTPTSMLKRGTRLAIELGSKYAKRKLSDKFIEMDNKRKRNKRKATPTRGSTSGSVNNIRNESGTGNGASFKIGRKKGVVIKKKPNVKVSPKFKRAVEEVLQTKMPVGIYQKTGLMGLIQVPAPTAQHIVYVDYPVQNQTSGELFSPQTFLDAVSVLWAGKPAQAQSRWNDAANVNPMNNMFNVINSYADMKFRNNSQRTLSCEFVEARPKTQKVQTTPTGQWYNSMAVDIAEGICLNPTPSDYLMMGVNPYQTSTYGKYYSESVTKAVIEPGQTFAYRIQGPNNQVFDMSKYVDDSYTIGGATIATPLYNLYNKEARFFYARVHTDLIADSANVGGRGPSTTAGHGLVCELSTYVKMECPRTVPVAGVRRAYKNVSFYPTLSSVLHRIDEQNPADDENPAE